jgi:hypothetical protein
VDVEIDEPGQDRRVVEVDRPLRVGLERAADRGDAGAAHEHRARLSHLRAVEQAVGGDQDVTAQLGVVARAPGEPDGDRRGCGR